MIKRHRVILALTIFIFIALVSIISYGYVMGLEELTIGNIIFSVFLIIWVTSFPMALYTCYRLIDLEEKKGHLLEGLIYSIHGGIFGGVFIVPILIGPLFIYDYILLYKRDKRQAQFSEVIEE